MLSSSRLLGALFLAAVRPYEERVKRVWQVRYLCRKIVLDIPHKMGHCPHVMRRNYLSIYFSNGDYKGKKKRDVTVSFKEGDELYSKCKELDSSMIREILGVYSYRDLVQKADQEDRPVGNYIKHKLREKLVKKVEG